MIDERSVFDQPVKNDFRTYNIQKSTTVESDDYTTSYFLDYPNFKRCNKLTVIDVDLKAIQQTNFTGNLDQNVNTQMFFVIEEVKETILDFSKEAVKVLCVYFVLIQY